MNSTTEVSPVVGFTETSTMVNNVTWSVDFYDGAPLLETNPQMAIPYVGALALAMLVGVIGNSLVIGAVYVEKKLRHDGYEFILNLAVSDFIITGFAGPMCILGITHGRRWFESRVWLCDVVASVCITSCICSLLNLGNLTLSKYCFILHRHVYNALFSKTKTILICIFTWIVAVTLEAMNFIGWGDHVYDDKSLKCTWDRSSPLSYTLYLAVGLLCVPLIGMTAAYTVIFFRIYQSKHNLLEFQGKDKKETTLKAIQEAIHTCRMMFVIMVAYAVCWGPYIVIILVGMGDHLPLWVHLWATYLSHLHSDVNCIVYALSSKVYRRTFWNMICCDWRGQGSSASDRSPGSYDRQGKISQETRSTNMSAHDQDTAPGF